MNELAARIVLLVEDADACASNLEIALLRLPDIIVKRVSSREALQILTEGSSKVCALITDLHMPLLDGFELIERVRADARQSHLPILVISGDSDPVTPARVRRLGANVYFPKPYSPGLVRQSLKELIHVE
jgi:PleD family two-component response regulator